MTGKKGMILNKNRENSPRFAEYYKKEHPEWTFEECENKAKWFKRSCNYQCIEYYEKKYPELSHEEHLNLKKQLQEQKKTNNKFHLEYYKKHYPELSLKEQEKLWHEYVRKHNYCCIEYYLNKGINKEIVEKIKNEKLKIAANKISKKISGELNGMHRSKRTIQQLKENSPFAKEFYLSRGLTEEDWKNFTKSIKREYNTQLSYYLNKGMSEDEAHKALRDKQTTFSYEKCIKKYGETEGNIIFSNRQQKWLKSLYESFQSNGDGRSKQSKFAKDIIINCCNKLNISIPKKEKYIYWKKTHQAFAYDFMINKKIIEFQGDYWHCNPKLYSKDFYNKSKQKTASEIWEYDKIKLECAKFYGYDVLYIWELDYNEEPEETIKKCIDFLKS